MTPDDREEVRRIASAEFDSLSKTMRVEVHDCGSDELKIVLCSDGDADMMLLSATRDQWGAWIAMNGTTIVGQEDTTRSFISALISSLQKVREMTECETLDATPMPITALEKQVKEGR